MKPVTFITGNQSKADYLAKYLGHPIEHHKLELEELQSLDLQKVVEHKVRSAYDILKTPVLVEDVSLEFSALGRLPGTFIKFFDEELGDQAICDLLTDKSRAAQARCMFGYYDGELLRFFEGGLNGSVATEPAGDGGFGWDRYFIPDGYSITRASLNEVDYKTTYTQLKPFGKIKDFLEAL